MSYDGDFTDSSRQAYMPAGFSRAPNRPTLLFQQSTKVEQIINLKAAKELDLDVPPSLLVRADEVIE